MSIDFSNPSGPSHQFQRELPPNFTTQQEDAGAVAHDLRSPITVLKLTWTLFKRIPAQLPVSERPAFQQLLDGEPMTRFKHEVESLRRGLDQLKVLNPDSIQILHAFFSGQRIKNAARFANQARNEMLQFLEKSEATAVVKENIRSQLADFLPGGHLQAMHERIQRVTPLQKHVVVDLTDLIRKNFKAYALELPNEGLHVFGDPRAIVDAVLNVLTNSSDHARVGVDLNQAIKLGKEANEAVLEISDNGKGIPALKVAQLNQGYKVETTKEGGSGTGTIIARRMAQSHGGSLVYDSHHDPVSKEPRGAWTKATFRIPLHRA
ncbi:sensor histidine kinase [Candidatus Micrarchaeota archaeon]|nr:sensor histidine kinase [Candidatus Micrarchaeota archaeon]